jgi:uncharacterized protein (TIGR02145 family)
MTNTWRGDPAGTALKDGGSSGYDALLSGRWTGSSFQLINSYEFFWACTESSATYAWRRCLQASSAAVGRYDTFSKTSAMSVRCVLN